jgi:replicative DNA helicase
MSFDNSQNREISNVAALKVPPHSVDAEQAVLGGLMLDNTEWDNLADVLLPEDFYRPEHQIIFRPNRRVRRFYRRPCLAGG